MSYRAFLAVVLVLPFCLSQGCGIHRSMDLGTEEGNPSGRLRSALTGTELVLDGEFDMGLASWTANVHKPGSATIKVVPDPDDPMNSVLKIRNYEKQDFYKVQFYQENLTIKDEYCYCLSFEAWASGRRSISAQVYQGVSPWAPYGLWATPVLTTVRRMFEGSKDKLCFFANLAGDEVDDARVGFNFGDTTGTVWIDKISLTEYGHVDEIDSCPPAP